MSTMTRNVKNETRGKWQNRYDKVQIRKLDFYLMFLWVWWASSYDFKDEWVHISMSLDLILTSMITYSKIKDRWIDSEKLQISEKRQVQKSKQKYYSRLQGVLRNQSRTKYASLRSREHIKCALRCLNDHSFSWLSHHRFLSFKIPRDTRMSTMTRNVKNETRGKWQNRYDKVQIRKLDFYLMFLWVWWASSYDFKDEWVHISMSLDLILTSMITYSKINLPDRNHMRSPIPKKSKIMDTIWYPVQSDDRIRSLFTVSTSEWWWSFVDL